jgi:hypothetical protein
MTTVEARNSLSMWTVYDHPADYPNDFVARRSEIGDHGICITRDMFVAPTLAELRALLPPGLYRMPRAPHDDLMILEVWL